MIIEDMKYQIKVRYMLFKSFIFIMKWSVLCPKRKTLYEKTDC